MQPNEQSKPKKNTARPLGRLGAFLLVTLALLLITLLGVIWVLEKGKELPGIAVIQNA